MIQLRWRKASDGDPNRVPVAASTRASAARRPAAEGVWFGVLQYRYVETYGDGAPKRRFTGGKWVPQWSDWADVKMADDEMKESEILAAMPWTE